MKTNLKHYLLLLLLFVSACANAEKIHSKEYRFKIKVPSSMSEVSDSLNVLSGNLYYDSSARIVLIISGRESRYKAVTDYVDCGMETLEQNMRTDYVDQGLQLISCNKS